MFRSFELDPTMKRDVSYNIYEKLAQKYGMSVAQAKASCDNMEQMAKSVGLEFKFDTLILTNTFDAHRLAMYAKTEGKMHEMTERILRAYYTESKHIGDHETLIGLANEVGLNEEAVAKMLESAQMADEVRADEQAAKEYGIHSIPYFLINKKYAITGAQPTETIVEAIEKILKEDNPYTNVNMPTNEKDSNCGDDGCDLPK